jgi:predicted dehydrogenase/aryl-alcohol dehydrogenase-like predicted oxidoreductase
MSQKLAWGIMSTGRIAKAFANALKTSTTGTLIAVGSRDQQSADEFGDEFIVKHRHPSYQELLDNPEVQAVYIAPPHPLHAEWAIKAAEASKHILCEKPLTLNHAEAMAVIEAARQNDVFLMEAFMYRCHPQTAKLVELIRDRVIGDVRVIQATFSFGAGFNAESRIYNNALGGGGIMDVGCYCTSMARLIAGAATGKDFAEPTELKAVGHLGETGVDEYTVAVLKFPGDIVAQLSTGVAVGQESVVRIFGTEGSILVPAPWFCSRDDGSSVIVVNRNGEESRDVVVEAPAGLYTIEADTVAANIERRQAPSPAMSWADTLGNIKTLERWRLELDFLFDAEKPGAPMPPVDNRPLKVRGGNNMKYGRIEGIDKQVSRLVLGTMLEGAVLREPHGFALWDEFFRCGGNCFDTAHIYGGGLNESTFGRWMKNRGIRDDLVIIGKGAHTPYCDPENLTSQLLISLERMQVDKVDIYMMHRDNPDIPVGEFVDVLNGHVQAGRIGIFGGSNWSTQRTDEANEYAKSKGLQGFSVLSNNFSLARMVDPVWGGCIQSSDPESREWFTRTQTPLFAWSSQARGFFVRADRDYTADKDLVRCWYSDDNFDRYERVQKMAKECGVIPINIALAYVLNQPFPTYPLIGPANLYELHTGLPALDIELTPEELRWLNLED